MAAAARRVVRAQLRAPQFVWARRRGEPFARVRNVFGSVAVGEQPIVSDAMEALRQQMDQETPDELVGSEIQKPDGGGVRKLGIPVLLSSRAKRRLSHNVHFPSQDNAAMANSEDVSDNAFAGLYELFSKPIKSPQKAFRTHQLSFENGEPVFTLSEADRILEEVFEEMFRPRSN
jgi:hypothetical protein